jgi:hypothetical protein
MIVESMKRKMLVAMLPALLGVTSCVHVPERSANPDIQFYARHGRATDPMERADFVSQVPADVDAICRLGRNLSEHYRMLTQQGISMEARRTMLQVWPPYARQMFQALWVRGPKLSSEPRRREDRLLGACTQDAILTTSLLRQAGIPARIRVGDVTGIMRGPGAYAHWKKVYEIEHGGMEPFDTSPLGKLTRRAISDNSPIEHWIAEYWDATSDRWLLLDMRTDLERAYDSNWKPGFHVSREHFEYAWQAWQRIGTPGFDPGRYSIDASDGDGRTHIRQQLLYDFFNLLKHEAAGTNNLKGPASVFIRARSFKGLAREEIDELNRLAALMGTDPTVEKLVGFYRASKTLRLPDAEKDPYCAVFDKQDSPAAKKERGEESVSGRWNGQCRNF